MSKRKKVPPESVNRSLQNQDSCEWDELDFQAMKMYILEHGTSAATMHKFLPWRSRRNIERKLKSAEVSSFLKKWNDKMENIGKQLQQEFDQTLIQRTQDSVEEEIEEPPSKKLKSDNVYERYLQNPRIDVSDSEYYISYRHSLKTEVKWKLINFENRYFECDIIDLPWEEREWIHLIACRSISYVNSCKNELKHCIPFQAPEDAAIGGRKFVISYTKYGAVSTLILPRQQHNKPGEIECSTVYTEEFADRIPLPVKPKVSLKRLCSGESRVTSQDETHDSQSKKPEIGDRIQVWFADKNRYFAGKLVGYHDDGTYSVKYSGGHIDNNIELNPDHNNEDADDLERWNFVE